MSCSDAYMGSTIALKFTKKHWGSPDREVLMEYTISENTDQTPITRSVGAFPSLRSSLGITSKKPDNAGSSKSVEVTVKFPDPVEVGSPDRV